MDKKLVSGGLIAAGLGIAGFMSLPYLQQSINGQITNIKTSLTADHGASVTIGTPVLLTVSLDRTGGINNAVPVSVQACWVSNGVIAGHFFTSLSTAESAVQAYAQSNTSALQTYLTTPSDRVVTQMMKPGATATFQLFDATTYYAGLEVAVWATIGVQGSLLVQDASGNISSLPKPTTSFQAT